MYLMHEDGQYDQTCSMCWWD